VDYQDNLIHKKVMPGLKRVIISNNLAKKCLRKQKRLSARLAKTVVAINDDLDKANNTIEDMLEDMESMKERIATLEASPSSSSSGSSSASRALSIMALAKMEEHHGLLISIREQADMQHNEIYSRADAFLSRFANSVVGEFRDWQNRMEEQETQMYDRAQRTADNALNAALGAQHLARLAFYRQVLMDITVNGDEQLPMNMFGSAPNLSEVVEYRITVAKEMLGNIMEPNMLDRI
jgi:cell division septum initiation protein DivIVA